MSAPQANAPDATERGQGGPQPMYTSVPRRPRRRSPLGTLLSVLLGALLGAAVAIAMLVFAGPHPAPLPPSTATGSVSVTVDDAFLTASLRDALGQVPLGITVGNVRAHCVPGDRILLSADAEVGPFVQPGALSMTLQPAVSDGHLVVHVLDAHVGGLTLPGALDAQVEAAANAQLRSLGEAALAASPNYVVRGTQTTANHLTVVLGPATS